MSDNVLNARLQHAVEYTDNNSVQHPDDTSIPLNGEIVFNDDRTNFKVGDGREEYQNLHDFLPTIPAAQIQSDWNQTNSSALDYIKNKPTIPSVPATFHCRENIVLNIDSNTNLTDIISDIVSGYMNGEYTTVCIDVFITDEGYDFSHLDAIIIDNAAKALVLNIDTLYEDFLQNVSSNIDSLNINIYLSSPTNGTPSIDFNYGIISDWSTGEELHKINCFNGTNKSISGSDILYTNRNLPAISSDTAISNTYNYNGSFHLSIRFFEATEEGDNNLYNIY